VRADEWLMGDLLAVLPDGVNVGSTDALRSWLSRALEATTDPDVFRSVDQEQTRRALGLQFPGVDWSEAVGWFADGGISGFARASLAVWIAAYSLGIRIQVTGSDGSSRVVGDGDRGVVRLPTPHEVWNGGASASNPYRLAAGAVQTPGGGAEPVRDGVEVLRREIGEIGSRLVDVARDGDCFMNALITATGLPLTAAQVRARLADALERDLRLPEARRELWPNLDQTVREGLLTDRAVAMAGRALQGGELAQWRNALSRQQQGLTDADRASVVDQMRRAGSWNNVAGDIAPGVAADVFDLNLDIRELTAPTQQNYRYRLDAGQRPVQLVRDSRVTGGEHWMAVIPVSPSGLLERWQQAPANTAEEQAAREVLGRDANPRRVAGVVWAGRVAFALVRGLTWQQVIGAMHPDAFNPGVVPLPAHVDIAAFRARLAYLGSGPSVAGGSRGPSQGNVSVRGGSSRGDFPRGGSRDAGVDPVAAGVPVGARVVVGIEPREGVLAFTDTPAVVDGGKAAAGGALHRVVSDWAGLEPGGSDAVGTELYAVDGTGRIMLADGGAVPNAWVRHGADFLEPGTGTVLRGDSGWLGGIENAETLFESLQDSAGPAVFYNLHAQAPHLYLVPDDGAGQSVRVTGVTVADADATDTTAPAQDETGLTNARGQAFHIPGLASPYITGQDGRFGGDWDQGPATAGLLEELYGSDPVRARANNVAGALADELNPTAARDLDDGRIEALADAAAADENEMEVIFPPGTRFQVTGSRSVGEVQRISPTEIVPAAAPKVAKPQSTGHPSGTSGISQDETPRSQRQPSGPHIELDVESGIGWASSTLSALGLNGEPIPKGQRSCVEVTVIHRSGIQEHQSS
jgi:hypothetical protein